MTKPADTETHWMQGLLRNPVLCEVGDGPGKTGFRTRMLALLWRPFVPFFLNTANRAVKQCSNCYHRQGCIPTMLATSGVTPWGIYRAITRVFENCDELKRGGWSCHIDMKE